MCWFSRPPHIWLNDCHFSLIECYCHPPVWSLNGHQLIVPKKLQTFAFRSHSPSFTLRLFFSLQTCLRHPDCESARINKNAVFQRMRLALEQVIEIVTDARSSGEAKALPISIYAGIKDLKVQLWGKSFVHRQITDDSNILLWSQNGFSFLFFSFFTCFSTVCTVLPSSNE